MASDAAGSAADAAEVALLSSIQQRVFTAWPVRIASEPSKGRFMIARSVNNRRGSYRVTFKKNVRAD